MPPRLTIALAALAFPGLLWRLTTGVRRRHQRAFSALMSILLALCCAIILLARPPEQAADVLVGFGMVFSLMIFADYLAALSRHDRASALTPEAHSADSRLAFLQSNEFD